MSFWEAEDTSPSALPCLPRVSSTERGLGGEVAFRSMQRCPNILNDIWERLEHRFIGYSHHAMPLGFQTCLANSIFFSGILVNWPIDFDDEAGFRAIEIDDEALNRVLTPKLEPINLPTPQRLP